MSNSFYSIEETKQLGFKSVGNNVFISKNASFYDIHKISIGNNVRIDDFCILSGNITIGSYVHIAAYSAIYGKYGVIMEDFTGLSPRCTIYSAIDDFSGNFLISPMTYKDHNNIISGKVIINKFCQLGAETTVFPNLTLHEGSATGAKTLVTKSLEAWFIYTGIPATKIKTRSKKLLDFISEYD